MIKSLFKKPNLIDAVKKGNVQRVQELLNDPNTDINKDKPLFEAVKRGHYAIVKIFLDSSRDDIDLNIKDNIEEIEIEINLLNLAAYYGKDKIFELLMNDDRIDVNAKDRRGRNALDYVIFGWGSLNLELNLPSKMPKNLPNYDNIIDLLLKSEKFNGINEADRVGFTPLFNAIMYKYRYAEEKLKERSDLIIDEYAKDLMNTRYKRRFEEPKHEPTYRYGNSLKLHGRGRSTRRRRSAKRRQTRRRRN
jgi:ankyrin repeat protein